MSKAISLTCPECGEAFTPSHHRQQFCTPAHKGAFNNRQTGRGASLVILAQAWRKGRNASDPKAKEAAAIAFNRFCRALDAMNTEDREAGRVDALKMFQRRMAAGLVD